MEGRASAFSLASVLFCIWFIMPVFSVAQKQPESFGKAIKETAVDLGVDPHFPPGTTGPHVHLYCHYFRNFVVKELDSGQKGDDWISIATNDPAHFTPCNQEHASGESVFQDWEEGYFGGVEGNLVFLVAADCFDLGCPFGVYDAFTGKKLFEDQRRLSPKGKISEIRLVDNSGNLVMHYPRVVAAECSLPLKKSECWKEILRNTGLAPQPMPNCVGYSGFNRREGRGTDDKSDPSVVSFPVEVTIPGFHTRILPGPVECWAAD